MFHLRILWQCLMLLKNYKAQCTEHRAQGSGKCIIGDSRYMNEWEKGSVGERKIQS
jgi:hypothetical protein